MSLLIEANKISIDPGETKPGQIPLEQMSFGEVEFPRFLITQTTFNDKMAKIRALMTKTVSELRQGQARGDAGDDHGTYHSEIVWYAEQQQHQNVRFVSEIGEGLDNAVKIESYDWVRNQMIKSKILPTEKVTLTSKVKIQFGDDPSDTENIMIVAPLDGGTQPGWVSVSAPLAKAIEGKKTNEVATFKINNNTITIKVISLS